MSGIFDLQQQLMDCWRIVDDIKVLEEAVLDKEQSHNDTGNVLIGLEYLYQLKFEKLFATFENHCKEYHQYRIFYELNQAPEIGILDSQIAKSPKKKGNRSSQRSKRNERYTEDGKRIIKEQANGY